ncbi:hypothetical protein RI367_000415 [Sorochytrium milnesiophthora]
MKREPLSNEDFIVELGKCFDATTTKGTVFVTMKRHTWPAAEESRMRRKVAIEAQRTAARAAVDRGESADAIMSDAIPRTPADEADDKEYPCLVRAQRGTLSLTTVVLPVDTDGFLEKYGALLKSKLTSLRGADDSVYRLKYHNAAAAPSEAKTSVRAQKRQQKQERRKGRPKTTAKSSS